MDGLPQAGAPAAASHGLPSLGLPPSAVAPPPTMAPPPGGAPAPVGRPSTDPDKQEARVTKRAEINRLMELLPKTATDSKIYVYRIRGHNRREHRRSHTILMSDIEESGGDSEDFIINSILEECGEGKYECVAMSKANKRIPEFQPWQVIVGEYEDEGDDEEEGFIQPPGFAPGSVPGYDHRLPPHLQHLNPALRNDSRYSDAPPAPPTVHPPPNVLETMKAINETDREEKRDTMTMMLSMMNQNMQVLMATMQGGSQEQARIAAEREAREEKYRQEQRDREQREREREIQRSSERVQLWSAMIPLLIPVLTKMMDGKDDKLTPILLERMMERKEDASGMQNALSMVTAATKETIAAQGEANRQNMMMQGETSKQLIGHVLTMAQSAMEAQKQLEAGETEDASPVDRFLSTMERFAPLIGGLVGQQGNAPATAAPTMPQQPRIVPPDPTSQPTPVQRQPERTPKQPPPPADEDRSYNDDQLIGGCLNTIRQMHTGEVQEAHFGQALLWCAQAVPESMEAAILSQDKAKVFELATPVVTAHPALLQWIKHPSTNEFLTWAIEQIRLILMQIHQEAAQDAAENDGEVVEEVADEFDDVTAEAKPDADGAPDEEPPEVEPVESGGKIKPPPLPKEELPPAGTVEDDSGLGEAAREDFPPTDISQDIPPQGAPASEGESEAAEEG